MLSLVKIARKGRGNVEKNRKKKDAKRQKNKRKGVDLLISNLVEKRNR